MFQEPQNFNSLFPPSLARVCMFSKTFSFLTRKDPDLIFSPEGGSESAKFEPLFLSPGGSAFSSTGPPQRVRNNTSYKDRTGTGEPKTQSKSLYRRRTHPFHRRRRKTKTKTKLSFLPHLLNMRLVFFWNCISFIKLTSITI